jgi:membrane protein implicated in regulation of membrane protease activity
VTGSNWRVNRIALVVGALALLAGAPAVLAAAGIKNPLALGGATALAAVVVAVAAVWQDRYKRLAQRRDEQALQDRGRVPGADGRPPAKSP